MMMAKLTNLVDGVPSGIVTQKKTKNIVYKQRILIRPNACPDSSKYIQWETDLQIIPSKKSNHESFQLTGPFNFEAINQYNTILQKVHLDQWITLREWYMSPRIIPQKIGGNSSNQPVKEQKTNLTPKNQKRKYSLN